MSLLPPKFVNTVVSIGVPDGKEFKALASGFLVTFPLKIDDKGAGQYKSFIVSNRHVFEGMEFVDLRFNKTGSGHKLYRVYFTGKEKAELLQHPDPMVDLACVRVSLNKLKSEGIEYVAFKESEFAYLNIIKKVGISQGDGIFVLGFPMGIAGVGQNYVVVRGGTIARLDDEIINERRAFLIDSSVYPGNSGGPVVLRPEVTSVTGTEAVNRAYLLGVVSGYLPYEDVAISRQTNKPRVVFVENSGLSTVVPLDYLKDMVRPLLDETKKKLLAAESLQ